MRSRRPIIVAPSLLAGDFAGLADECAALSAAGARWMHLDLMDGRFIDNITFGPDTVAALRPYVTGTLDVHLEAAPDTLITALGKAGADTVTVHVEATAHLERTLDAIRHAGARVGVALNPGTPVCAITEVISRIDLVCVMSVNPGFGGQAFNAAVVPKIAAIRRLAEDRPLQIQADGGIDCHTAPAVAAAGADVLVAGSAVFMGGGEPKAERYGTAMKRLKRAAEGTLKETHVGSDMHLVREATTIAVRSAGG